MKCLISNSVDRNDWIAKYFPNLSPYLLKFCKKPLLEYYIDFCRLNNITEIRLLCDAYSSNVKKVFDNGSKWGVQLSYGLLNSEDEIPKIINKNSSFVDQEPVLVITGNGFINYHKDQTSQKLLQSDSDQILSDGDAQLLVIQNPGKFSGIEKLSENGQELSIIAIDGIQSYYDLNMDILQNRDQDFVLPGYNNENGVYIGRNVVIPRNVDIEKPVMLGDDVQLKPDTEIGPNVILGDKTIIDSDTTINDSIVFENSYIGSNLELDNKIVYKNRLIVPRNGTWLDINEKFFISDIQDNVFQGAVRRIVHILLAVIVFILQLLPFLILRPISGLKSSLKSFFVNQNGETRQFINYSGNKDTIRARLFYRFSLDKFPLLGNVLTGKLFLVGNRKISAQSENRGLLDNYPDYYPAVFDFPGLFTKNDRNKFIHDMFYLAHRNLGLEIKTLFKYLLKRLIGKLD